MAAKQEYPSILNESNLPKSVKILIVGDCGIGKTSVIATYLDLYYMPADEVNFFEEYRTRIKYNGIVVDVGLYDPSPDSTAPDRRQHYPRDVNAILVCFSIARYDSLKCVYNLWIHEVRAHYGQLMPIFLVGLRSETRLIEPHVGRFPAHAGIRIVKKSEAEDIHKRYRFYGDYMECSVYDRGSIVNVINKAFFAAMEN